MAIIDNGEQALPSLPRPISCQHAGMRPRGRRSLKAGYKRRFDSWIVLAYNGCIGVYQLERIGVKMEEQAVRWSITVSKDTDLTLRTFLGSQGMKKGDLSKFIRSEEHTSELQS